MRLFEALLAQNNAEKAHNIFLDLDDEKNRQQVSPLGVQLAEFYLAKGNLKEAENLVDFLTEDDKKAIQKKIEEAKAKQENSEGA